MVMSPKQKKNEHPKVFVLVRRKGLVCVFAREWAKTEVRLRRAVAADTPPACQILNLRVPEIKKIGHPKVSDLEARFGFDFGPHPYRMRPEIKGLSHGLKNSPPDCFSPRLRRGRPFESHPAYKKNRHPGWDNGFSGTPEGTRTPDLLIRSQSLYPTELPARLFRSLERFDIVSWPARNVKHFFEIF